MRWIIPLVLLVAVCLCGWTYYGVVTCPSKPGPNPSEVVAEATVTLLCPDGSSGSGVVVRVGGRKVVLTAAHVAGELGAKVEVRFEFDDCPGASRVWWGRCERLTARDDLAVVSVEDDDIALVPLPVERVRLHRGERVYYCGSPGTADEQLIRVSEVSVVAKVLDLGHGDPFRGEARFLVNGFSWHGHSGCPVAVARKGRTVLAGLLVGGAIEEPRTPATCVTSDAVCDFLGVE